jgi:hypothetical protein
MCGLFRNVSIGKIAIGSAFSLTLLLLLSSILIRHVYLAFCRSLSLRSAFLRRNLQTYHALRQAPNAGSKIRDLLFRFAMDRK